MYMSKQFPYLGSTLYLMEVGRELKLLGTCEIFKYFNLSGNMGWKVKLAYEGTSVCLKK